METYEMFLLAYFLIALTLFVILLLKEYKLHPSEEGST